MSTAETFGVSFFSKTLPNLVRKIKVDAKSEKFTYVVTPNVDHVIRLYKEPELKHLYDDASYTTCDSRILRSILKIQGHGDINVIPGSDLTEVLFSYVIDSHDKVAVLGADQIYIDRLVEQYELKNLVHYNPPMGFINDEDEVEKSLQFLEKSQANYYFLAVGSPRQEVIANMLKKRGKCGGVGFCIGASILFLTGGEPRAPYIIQRMSLEWLFRMICNPRRLAVRYLKDAYYLSKMLLMDKGTQRRS